MCDGMQACNYINECVGRVLLRRALGIELVHEKGLRVRISPTCTLSQNGYGDHWVCSSRLSLFGGVGFVRLRGGWRRCSVAVASLWCRRNVAVAPTQRRPSAAADSPYCRRSAAAALAGESCHRSLDCAVSQWCVRCSTHMNSKFRTATFVKGRWAQKADSTLRSSQAVPHPSTDRALRRLTSEVGRDPVHSTRYGRQRGCSTYVRLGSKIGLRGHCQLGVRSRGAMGWL